MTPTRVHEEELRPVRPVRGSFAAAQRLSRSMKEPEEPRGRVSLPIGHYALVRRTEPNVGGRRTLLAWLRDRLRKAGGHPQEPDRPRPWLIEEWKSRQGAMSIYVLSDGSQCVGVRGRSGRPVTKGMTDAEFVIRGGLVFAVGADRQPMGEPIYELGRRRLVPLAADRRTLQRVRFTVPSRYRLKSD